MSVAVKEPEKVKSQQSSNRSSIVMVDEPEIEAVSRESSSVELVITQNVEAPTLRVKTPTPKIEDSLNTAKKMVKNGALVASSKPPASSKSTLSRGPGTFRKKGTFTFSSPSPSSGPSIVSVTKVASPLLCYATLVIRYPNIPEMELLTNLRPLDLIILSNRAY